MPRCDAPIPDEVLLDYWVGAGEAAEADAVEAHLFACGDCTARLAQVAALGAGVVELVRQGRVSGVVSRGLVNHMQRHGVRLRVYALVPGETVPCAAFPGDDLLVASLRADFSKAESVRLAVTGSGDALASTLDDVPVSSSQTQVFWALPGAVVRRMPSARLELTLTSAADDGVVLGRYVLEHTGEELSGS